MLTAILLGILTGIMIIGLSGSLGLGVIVGFFAGVIIAVAKYDLLGKMGLIFYTAAIEATIYGLFHTVPRETPVGSAAYISKYTTAFGICLLIALVYYLAQGVAWSALTPQNVALNVVCNFASVTMVYINSVSPKTKLPPYLMIFIISIAIIAIECFVVYKLNQDHPMDTDTSSDKKE